MRDVRRKTWGRFARVGRNIGGKPCQKVSICRHVRRIEPVSPIAFGPVFAGILRLREGLVVPRWSSRQPTDSLMCGLQGFFDEIRHGLPPAPPDRVVSGGSDAARGDRSDNFVGRR